MTLPGDFLMAMESYLGLAEDPPKSNRTRVGVKFGWNGVAWCAETVSCAAADVGYHWFHTASVYQIRTWAQQGFNGLSWHGVNEAQPGDIFCYHGDAHTGAVAYLKGGGFVSVEGNWGDRCQRVVRNGWSDIAGLARLPWSAAMPANLPPTVPTDSNVPATQVRRPGFLQDGDQGLEVALVQLRLNNLAGVLLFSNQTAWPHCETDGVYGSVTAAAVNAFQVKYGLDSDGVWGPLTAGKMSAVEAFCGIHY